MCAACVCVWRGMNKGWAVYKFKGSSSLVSSSSSNVCILLSVWIHAKLIVYFILVLRFPFNSGTSFPYLHHNATWFWCVFASMYCTYMCFWCFLRHCYHLKQILTNNSIEWVQWIPFWFIYLTLCFPPICIFAILGRVGCPQYMAPEVVSRRIYGKGCDVWGAGKKYTRIIELLQVMCVRVCCPWNERFYESIFNVFFFGDFSFRNYVACFADGSTSIFGFWPTTSRHY